MQPSLEGQNEPLDIQKLLVRYGVWLWHVSPLKRPGSVNVMFNDVRDADVATFNYKVEAAQDYNIFTPHYHTIKALKHVSL